MDKAVLSQCIDLSKKINEIDSAIYAWQRRREHFDAVNNFLEKHEEPTVLNNKNALYTLANIKGNQLGPSHALKLEVPWDVASDIIDGAITALENKKDQIESELDAI